MSGTRAAVFSFLRVLAVALASAILPFLTAPQSDDVPVRAIVTAVVAAFLLTVINYFRPGETRFGPHATGVHEHDLPDAGRTVLGLIGLVLAVVGAIVLLLILLDVIAASVSVAVIALVIGVVLLLVDGNGTRV